MEARLLTLRPAGGWVPPALEETPPSSFTTRRRYSLRGFGRLGWWLGSLTLVGLTWTMMDQGGHGTTFRPAVSPPFTSGSGRVALALTPGAAAVRVSVTDAPGPWFWCLESSLGLSPAQHLCRNSGATDQTARSITTTDGVVQLDAEATRGASFFVQMYCHDGCNWQAEAAQDAR